MEGVSTVRSEEFDPRDVAIRSAATLVVIRDASGSNTAGPSGEVSVLLLQRSLSASFVPGAFVFAGGAIDSADHHMAHALTNEPSGPEQRKDPSSSEEYAAKIASLRECFEEAGLLPACLQHGSRLATIPQALVELRKQVHSGQVPFAQALAENSITPNLSAIVPFGRWVTPAGPPRRFDTRFFIAAAPLGQEALEDGSELIASRWMTPTTALAAADAGELLLIFPTRKTLERLRGIGSFAHCLHREGIVPAS
jgi:8-oxo-dGTP pyrophosphatase MutT (NUDIX family)